MVKPEISETQFVYGATSELEEGNWRYPLVQPPRFPTQNIEGDIGYDVDALISNGAGMEPLFLQYKRSEHMVGAQARHWKEFPSDYYRFKIKNAKQHNTLIETADYYPHTYYVAPIFSEMSEYASHHRNETILENTVFATCYGLPEMDEGDSTDRHTIGFTENQTKFFSEPMELDSVVGLEYLLSEILEADESFTGFGEIRESFAELTEALLAEVDAEIERPAIDQSPSDWIRAEQDFFKKLGAELVFLFDETDDS
ncbi:hypothetical protein [Halobellus limi]|uniref:Uncharacterized protein n=1 Tax=Halobellus limi TaxID=699433 RepID=A0A1H6AMH6_9EURY|nr:hypothetical protein [Halobellus limi]QCC47664.1 hypothetical protein DV707_08330 [Halobellus limi]SEG49928.1 hypothetical protein SAMN04488133_2408 [Halobellus limi]